MFSMFETYKGATRSLPRGSDKYWETAELGGLDNYI